MKCGPMIFTVITHKDGALAHNLEIGPLPVIFSLPYVMRLFIRSDEELR